MLVDLTQIPYDEIKPNSILVVRLPIGYTFTDADKGMIDSLAQAMRDKIDKSVNVLIMRHDTQIYNIDEELMNQMGWFKQAPPPSVPPKGTAPSV